MDDDSSIPVSHFESAFCNALAEYFDLGIDVVPSHSLTDDLHFDSIAIIELLELLDSELGIHDFDPYSIELETVEDVIALATRPRRLGIGTYQ